MNELLDYSQHKEFSNNKSILLDVYQGFIQGFESKVDQVKLMQFVMMASDALQGLIQFN